VGARRTEYDYIVVGAGALGTSIAYHLSRVPGRTLVLERFQENHPFGSSHGRSRILRTAYAEGPAYVPLVLRARHLWNRLGREAGQEIFRPTGVLLAGRSNSLALAGAQASARRYALPYERLDSGLAQRRFPTFRFGRGDAALWDPGGGVLFPERAIRAYRRLAHARGVVFRWNSPVLRWSSCSDGRILVRTAQREYLGRGVALSAGAWLPSLVPELRLPLEVEQQTVYWFRSDRSSAAPYRAMPAFVWYGPRSGYYYGTPDVGDGVKVGGRNGQRVRDLAHRPPASARELRAVRRFLKARLPGLSTAPRRAVRCLYTNTPDKHFIVDAHPGNPPVVLVSACSGHGFKFASALGELIAHAMRTGRPSPLLAPFGLPGRRRGEPLVRPAPGPAG
jgi:sarcosine oxidase